MTEINPGIDISVLKKTGGALKVLLILYHSYFLF